MSKYEFDEIPSWAVDWVNKIFTLIYEIERIEEVYIWWAAYRNFSFSWKNIILQDAPPAGKAISVDYFWADAPQPIISTDVSLWEVILDVYEKIGQKRENNKVYLESQVKKWIVEWLKRIKNGKAFKDDIQQYSFNCSANLTAAWELMDWITIWENISYVPSSWYWMIANSWIFKYNNYIGWKLYWSIQFNYKSWSKVLVAYRLPQVVNKVSEVLIDWFPLEYRDMREYGINMNYYTIMKMDDWNQYLFLPYMAFSKIITVKYSPVTNRASLDGELLDIEREYYEVLSYYTLWKLYEDREDDRADRMMRRYNELLTDYRVYKSKAVDWIRNRLKIFKL